MAKSKKTKKQNAFGIIKKEPITELKSFDQTISTHDQLQENSLYGLDELSKKLYYEHKDNQELLTTVIKSKAADLGALTGNGVLEILENGSFLRSAKNSYLHHQDDPFVNSHKRKLFKLRTGDQISCTLAPDREHEGHPVLLRIETINDKTLDELDDELDESNESRERVNFYDLEPVYPNEQLVLEHDPQEYSTRIIDLISPIGKGQRGLVVAPPYSGKTTILTNMARGIEKNYPEMLIIFLLIDERPEEVTKIKRSTSAEIISSTFDEDPDRHLQVADMTIEKAKRYVESGKDVIIFLDSITRYVRARNIASPNSGKLLSGGIDSKTLLKPRKFFGAARNFDEKGSLTIIASALIETGSRGDEYIYEELKGTANMEVHLSQELLEQRIFPSIDINKSKTREEELLLDTLTVTKMRKLRRTLNQNNQHIDNTTSQMLGLLKQYNRNVDYINNITEDHS